MCLCGSILKMDEIIILFYEDFFSINLLIGLDTKEIQPWPYLIKAEI